MIKLAKLSELHFTWEHPLEFYLTEVLGEQVKHSSILDGGLWPCGCTKVKRGRQFHENDCSYMTVYRWWRGEGDRLNKSFTWYGKLVSDGISYVRRREEVAADVAIEVPTEGPS
jgi:hypothetical protein